MGKKKPRQPRICPVCGMRFFPKYASDKRRFCSNGCVAEKLRQQHRVFKVEPDGTDIRQARRRAQKLLPSGDCVTSTCNNKGTDVHHKNGNPLDNRERNIERLCRSCHTKLHPKHNAHMKCRICGKSAIARELCHTHYKRWQIHGDPLLVTDKWGNENRQVEILNKGAGALKGTCKYCDGKIKALGMCQGHYYRWNTYGDAMLEKDRSGNIIRLQGEL